MGLYGWDALIRGLVPRQVNPEQRWHGFEFPAGGPVVQLVGGRGSGKSAVLGQLVEEYRTHAPVVRADLAAVGFDVGLFDPTDDDTPNSSSVTDLLYALSHLLHVTVHRRRPLVFPKLQLGLLAITSWEPSATIDQLRHERARIGQIVASDEANQERRMERTERWVDDVINGITVSLLVPGLDAVVRASLALLAREVFSPRVYNGALSWWESRPVQAQGDGLEQLVALANCFRRGDAHRDRAEKFLVAAFLDDISDHYSWFRELDRHPRPLVLLDNVHTEPGKRFLPLLLSAHHDASHDRGRTRLAFVTTALGDASAHPSVRTVSRASGWQPPAGPAAWLLPLGAPALELDDIMDLLAQEGAAAQPPHLARVIRRLTEGRGSSARALAEAAVERLRGGGGFRTEELLGLDAAGHPGTAVTGRLLEELLPDPSVRRHLVFFSAALDDHDARSLNAYLPDGAAAAAAQNATEYLREQRWPHRSGPLPGAGAFVGDRPLRTLLLHQLRGTPTGAGPTWDQIHRRLRSQHVPRTLGPEAGEHDRRYLYYSLALNDSEPVVHHLHRLFTACHPSDWLATVNTVCAAPGPADGFRHAAPDGPADEALCPGCGSHAVHRAIHWLVHALWQQSDPLAAPDERHITRVEASLLVLATEHSDPGDAFFHAHREWPVQLRNWTQAPDLPIQGVPGP